MKKVQSLLLTVLLGALALSFVACDNTSTITDSQFVADLAWRPDGAGMYGLIERTTQAATQVNSYDAFDLYRVDANGQIGERMALPSPVYQGYFPGLFLSADGSAALLQSGSNIVRVDLGSNASTVALQSTYLLAASPDLHYVVTTGDGAVSTTKLCYVYDISSAPSRRIAQFNAVNVTNNRALWLSAGQFAMTHFDSTSTPYLSVYDTLGHMLQSYPDAEAAFHASAYAPLANALFVRDHSNHIAKLDLATGQRTIVVPTSSVISMDASRDGSLLAYTSTDTLGNRLLRIVNVATKEQKDVGTDAISVFVSPQANKLSYIHYVDPYNQDIRTIDVTLP